MQAHKQSIGWKALDHYLGDIVDAINSNEPQAGEGISVSDGVNGKIINVAQKGKTAAQKGQGVETGQWINVDVLDENCKRSTIQVWGRVVSN